MLDLGVRCDRVIDLFQIAKVTLAGRGQDEEMVYFSVNGGNINIAGSRVKFKKLLEL